MFIPRPSGYPGPVSGKTVFAQPLRRLILF